MIKSYNRPREHLWQTFQLHPFAGLDLYSVHLDPPAIGVTGVGCIGFSADGDGPANAGHRAQTRTRRFWYLAIICRIYRPARGGP